MQASEQAENLDADVEAACAKSCLLAEACKRCSGASTENASSLTDPQDDAPGLVGIFQRHRWLALACLLMVSIGVLVGIFAEGWTFATSLYVIAQIVTTVGYGDVTVKGEVMQFFMAMYVLFSLLLIANLLSLVTNYIFEKKMRHIRERMHRMEFVSKLRSRFEVEDAKGSVRAMDKPCSKANKIAWATCFFAASIAMGMVSFRIAQQCTCPADASECKQDTYELCKDTGGVQLTWVNVFYMAVITVTTVGFGDYTPKSEGGRLFAVFWMVVGVACTGYFISTLSSVIADDQDDAAELEDAGDINEALFRAMDQDGNGYLSRSEYSQYILVKHGLLDKEILDDINKKFSSMDPCGTNQVTWQMVQQAALRSRSQQDHWQMVQCYAGSGC